MGKSEQKSGEQSLDEDEKNSGNSHEDGKIPVVTAAKSLLACPIAALDELPRVDGGSEVKVTKPVRASRKSKAGPKRSDAANGTIPARVRKPRKAIKKSESIILNSDEPEDVVTAVAEPMTIACEDSGIFIEDAELPTRDAHDQIAPTMLSAQGKEIGTEHVNPSLTSDVVYDEVSIHFQKHSRDRGSSPINQRGDLNKAEPTDPVQSDNERRDADAKATEVVAFGPNQQSRSLTATIEGLSYAAHSDDVDVMHRTETGESLTKRRRVDPGEANALDLATGPPNEETNPEILAEAKPAKSAKKTKADKPAKTAKAPAMPKVKKAKAEKVAKPPKAPKIPKTPKPKKPKTKARTITDLVTSAYRPAAEGAVETPMVSAFFTPLQETTKLDTQAEPVTAPVSEAAKAKKPREPKIIDPHQTTARKAKGGSAAKPRKRKTKVKFNEENHLPELMIPEMARAIEKTQGFLFGTSSQLAAEESPTFIRDMQLAIEHSEAFLPLAPHVSRTGTSLKRIRDASCSPQKTRTGLWREATRDREGGLQTCGRRRRVKGSFDPRPLESATKPNERPDVQPPVQLAIPVPQLSHPEIVAPESGPATLGANDEVRDLAAPMSDAPAITHECARAALIEAALPAVVDPGAPTVNPTSPVQQHSPPVSDDWMLLRSDTTSEEEAIIVKYVVSAQRHATKDQAQPLVGSQPAISVPSKNIGTRPVAGSQNSSAVGRAPLRTLDRNISPAKTMAMGGMIEKQRVKPKINDVDAVKSSSAPAAKPRGRPRKDEASATPQTRKTRPQERAGAGTLNSEALPRLTTATSQPEKPMSSQWMAIDEISDSDTPATPSPPRIRRAASSPPTIRPLPLSLPPSPAEAEIPILLHPILNITDAAWPGVRAILFPKITHLVKSTPPSTEMNLPTWHEKMLLYDPIVLEDLTAWLTEQGLKYKLRRPFTKGKTKSAAKSRKKTSDAVIEMEDGEVSASEFDIVQEEVKPWMVQRWCEEKSICCLWKEGLRGGVKVKY
jgi:hypothetical protein